MKKNKRLIGILIVFILIACITWNVGQIRDKCNSLLDSAMEFINKKTNDLKKLTGKGSLVDSRDNLKDSKITGENYVNDDRYYPYYTMISTKEKKLYQQIYANIIEYQTTFIPVVSVDKNNLETAITAVYNDHPEIFWTDLNYSYKYLKSKEVVQVTLKFNSTFKNIESSKKTFENQANKIVRDASKLGTDYEKEKYVHDTLISMIFYDKNSDLNQSAYSALVFHSSVCAGYSKAFQYIMIQLNIPTYYVSGESGEDHAWNIVKLSDGYYNVDVTWDDNRGISYNYFNVPDYSFSKTHTRTELSRYLPTCNGTQYRGVKKKEEKKINVPEPPKKEEPIEKKEPEKSWIIEEEKNTEKEEPQEEQEKTIVEEPSEKEEKETIE